MSWWLLALVIWFVVSFGFVLLVISASRAGQLTGRRSPSSLQALPDHDRA